MKLLGIVTLYHPSVQEEMVRIRTYIDGLDRLIVWNNSEDDGQLERQIMPLMTDVVDKLVWINNDCNRYIAEAINYALSYALENKFDALLVMDQDSQWTQFQAYKQVSMRLLDDYPEIAACSPYIWGISPEKSTTPYPIRSLINSGTIFRIAALREIGGADECFPLDGLDNDLSYRLQKAGFQLYCIPNFELHHELGHPMRSKILKIYTTNYNAQRTYLCTKGQLMVIRKHSDFLTWHEIWIIIKEYILWKAIRIMLVEPDKWNRTKSYLKGIIDGLKYKA